MPEQQKFICRKRKRKNSRDIAWITTDRMPYYSSATISLYACGESTYLPRFQQKSTLMAYYAVEYICEGQYTVISGDSRYQVEAGEILIHYPGMVYRRMNIGGTPMRKKEIMLNNSPLLSILCNRSALNSREVIRCGDPGAVESYFDTIRELVSSPVPGANLEKELPNTVFALFTELITQCGESSIYNSFDDQLKRLNVFSPDLTLEKMADHFKTGKRTLNRMFKKQLNLSPIQYVIAKRMRYAVQLLNSNTLSIKDVAEECGYKSTSFFIAEFKKHFQATPLAYRTGTDIFNNRKVYLLDGWNRKPDN